MKIMVSACLLGQKCKYSGGDNYDEATVRFCGGHEVFPVCPELSGGLSVPRRPCEIVDGIVMNDRGENVDSAFRLGARLCLRQAIEEKIDLAVLQPRSPSCGVKQVYDGSFSGRLIEGSGVFAELLLKNGFRAVDADELKKLPETAGYNADNACEAKTPASALDRIKSGGNGNTMRKNEAVLYIHGMGGSAAECEHYKPLFPDCEVIGLDYKTFTPWETGAEIREAVTRLAAEYENVTLIANSIGAFFCMNAGIDGMLREAYFISPLVDMEKRICDMMLRENVSEEELEEKGVISTGPGGDLSWTYLCYVREHPVRWAAPTSILYGGRDGLTSFETVSAFAKKHGAVLTVMENGEHWFHTDEQMRFLDDWLAGRGRRSGLKNETKENNI